MLKLQLRCSLVAINGLGNITEGCNGIGHPTASGIGIDGQAHLALGALCKVQLANVPWQVTNEDLVAMGPPCAGMAPAVTQKGKLVVSLHTFTTTQQPCLNTSDVGCAIG